MGFSTVFGIAKKMENLELGIQIYTDMRLTLDRALYLIRVMV